MTHGRRWLLVVCALAVFNGLFFIAYQRPDWNRSWSDQDGYRRLGQVLRDTGKFTRFPDAPRFVPEVIRTPAYPLFVAAVYSVAGESQTAVAVAQTALFVAICVFVFWMTRPIAGEPVALAAATLTAVFPPLPYFGALVMTELWTAFVFTAAMAALMRALRTGTILAYAGSGILFGIAALSRPAFALFPLAVGGVVIVLFTLLRVTARKAYQGVVIMLVAFGVTMSPWFVYNYVNLGRITLSPAGGVGRGLWEGSWQGVWAGRIQAELTDLADSTTDRRELDARVEALASRERTAAKPMLDYVHQWQDIRRIWTEPTDPVERADARIRADQEYERVALQNLRAEPATDLVRRLARGVFILWAGELPFRYTTINELPGWLIRMCWSIQALLFAAAIVGTVGLWRSDRRAEALLLTAPIIYITAVHFPLLKEARQSLPSKPVMLLLAAVGGAYLSGHLLPRESQVHEREHL